MTGKIFTTRALAEATGAIYALLSGLTLLLVLALPGCMTASIQDAWRDQALRAGRFDTGCQALKIVDEQPEPTQTRYRMTGCGRQAIYVCRNTGDSHRSGAELLVEGSHTIDAECRPL